MNENVYIIIFILFLIKINIKILYNIICIIVRKIIFHDINLLIKLLYTKCTFYKGSIMYITIILYIIYGDVYN